MRSQKLDDVTSGLASQQSGNGWPFWLPPQTVLARIVKSGTQIIEVRVIPVFAKNADVSVAALTLILARDPSTDT